MDNELGSIETEMKRGFLQLLVLVLLEKEAYGYAMVRAFRDLGYEVEENTLYPLLRRLEKRGLVQGRWQLGEERPRKVYAVTAAGREMRAGLLDIWQKQIEIIKHIIKENVHA
ncbi:MAG: PadR family transcriptional regulator [Acidobacteria bacterium]|jgi:DNA-binding PadR family transcriptional regulator|nr:PadR family transcriptional regulator [Acidobacteriota bacterium]